VSGIGWFIFTAGTMAGDLSQAFHSDILKAMVQATDFGILWSRDFVLLAIAAALLLRLAVAPGSLGPAVSSGFAAGKPGGNGPCPRHRGMERIHSPDIGRRPSYRRRGWLGGLWPLGLMIAASSSRISQDRLAVAMC